MKAASVGKENAGVTFAEKVGWLSEVQEVCHGINPPHPVRVIRRTFANKNNSPQPSVAFPEKHPYCEITLIVKGSGDIFIGSEKGTIKRGQLALIGPGVPHYGVVLKYPAEVITVHFLPLLVFEIGANGDGGRILARFTNQTLARQIVRPSKGAYKCIGDHLAAMLHEIEYPKFGSEISLRLHLMNALIGLLRWEGLAGPALKQSEASKWNQIEKVLRFIYKHYAEPLYIEQIARESGLSKSGLHRLFRDAVGMSCVQYLSAYRISRAALLLAMPGARVADVALAVGFETLSHFNSAFHRHRGMSPTGYIASQKEMPAGGAGLK